MSIEDWSVYRSGVQVTQDAEDPVHGPYSLRMTAQDTDAIRAAVVIPKARPWNATGQGRCRTLININSDALESSGQYGIVCMMDRQNIISEGNFIFVALFSNGRRSCVIQIFHFTEGLLKPPDVVDFSDEFDFTPGVPKALEVEWHCRYNRYNGTRIIVRTGDRTDYSDLSLFLDRSFDITFTRVDIAAITEAYGLGFISLANPELPYITEPSDVSFDYLQFQQYGMVPIAQQDLGTNLNVHHRMSHFERGDPWWGTRNSVLLTEYALAFPPTDTGPKMSPGHVTPLCVHFDGVGTQYLQRDDYEHLDINIAYAAADIQFCGLVWVNFDNVEGRQTLVMRGRGTDLTDEYRLYLDAGTFRFRVSNGTISGFIDSGVMAEVGKWHLVYYFHDSFSNQIGIRVDNNVLGSSAYSFGVFSTGRNIVFGARGNTDITFPVMSEFYLGRMNGWSWFRYRVLTLPELNYAWNDGKGRDFPMK